MSSVKLQKMEKIANKSLPQLLLTGEHPHFLQGHDVHSRKLIYDFGPNYIHNFIHFPMIQKKGTEIFTTVPPTMRIANFNCDLTAVVKIMYMNLGFLLCITSYTTGHTN